MISSSVLIIYTGSCNCSGKQRDVGALNLNKAPLPQLLSCCHTPLVAQGVHNLHRQLLALDTSLREVRRAPNWTKLGRKRGSVPAITPWKVPGVQADSQHGFTISNSFVLATREGCKEPLG